MRIALHAELLAGHKPPLPGRQRHGDAEAAGIAVQADAFDLEILAVEPEAGVGFEFEFADAKSDGYYVIQSVRPISATPRVA